MNTTEVFTGSNSSCNVCVDALSDEAGSLQDPTYYSYRYRIVGTFFQGIVLIVGVLGNLLVVVVVKRTQNMHTPTNCYLVSLALADCMLLLSSVPNEILSYYLVGNHWVWGEFGCASLVFGQNLGINASSLSLLAFSVDRYIAICHPVKAQRVCTVSRAKWVVAGLWAFSLMYCSPWLGLTTTRPLLYKGYRDIVQCDLKLPRAQYLIYFFIDLLVFYVVLVVVSCVLYGLIARVLFSRKIVNTQAKQNGVLHHETSNTAKWKVVRLLLLVVIVFVILWLPYRGLLVYNSFATLLSKKKFMDLWFLMFAKTCIYINSSIKPILYNTMSGKFRRGFHKVLRCPRSAAIGSSGSATASTTSGIFSSLRKSLRKSTAEEPELKADPGSSNDMNITSFKEPVQEDTYGQTEL